MGAPIRRATATTSYEIGNPAIPASASDSRSPSRLVGHFARTDAAGLPRHLDPPKRGGQEFAFGHQLSVSSRASSSARAAHRERASASALESRYTSNDRPSDPVFAVEQIQRSHAVGQRDPSRSRNGSERRLRWDQLIAPRGFASDASATCARREIRVNRRADDVLLRATGALGLGFHCGRCLLAESQIRGHRPMVPNWYHACALSRAARTPAHPCR